MDSSRKLTRFLTELAAPLLAGELFDHLPDTVFFLKDTHGRYVAVNTTLVERCGRRLKPDLLGRTVHDLFPAELAASYAVQDQFVLETGGLITGKLELHLYPNCRPGWCLTHKLPLKDARGQVVGLVGLSRDLHTAESTSAIPASLVATCDYLHAHYGESLSVAMLARRAKLSPVRFSRLVKRIYQLTPTQLILQARLQAAARQLRETTAPVAAIAHACGFYDHSTFCRHFKSATGLTPLTYRDAAGQG